MWPMAWIASSSTGDGKVEADQHLPRLALLLDRRVEPGDEAGALRRRAEPEPVARREAPSGTGEGPPSRRVDPLEQRHRDGRRARAADALAVQFRRDHLGVVEDEHIARREQVRQVADVAVVEPLPRLHHEQPGRVARPRRAERDALLRQVEIEEIDAHAAPVSSANRRGRAPRAR